MTNIVGLQATGQTLYIYMTDNKAAGLLIVEC